MRRGYTGIGLLITLLATACTDEPFPLTWEIVFSDSVDSSAAVRVQARILSGGCAASTELYVSDIPPSAPEGPVPPRLGRGLYGFDAVAVDARCRGYAAGCEELTLPATGPTTVTVTLDAPRAALCDPSECNAGACGVGGDAGMDGAMDVALPDSRVLDANDAASDATPDTLDAMSDARDATTDARPTCDEVFSGAPAYFLCEETSDSCEFYVNLPSDSTCASICMAEGATCIASYQERAAVPCERLSMMGCGVHAEDFICICSRP